MRRGACLVAMVAADGSPLDAGLGAAQGDDRVGAADGPMHAIVKKNQPACTPRSRTCPAAPSRPGGPSARSPGHRHHPPRPPTPRREMADRHRLRDHQPDRHPGQPRRLRPVDPRPLAHPPLPGREDCQRRASVSRSASPSGDATPGGQAASATRWADAGDCCFMAPAGRGQGWVTP
jgi:hypothetical protein